MTNIKNAIMDNYANTSKDALKVANFDGNKEDFASYKSVVWEIQKAVSKVAVASKHGMKDAVAVGVDNFYAAYGDFLKLIGNEYKANGLDTNGLPVDLLAFMPHAGSFRKQEQSDGVTRYVFMPTGDASFRKNFERTIASRISGGEMKTCEQIKEERKAKAAAKRAAEKAQKEAEVNSLVA